MSGEEEFEFHGGPPDEGVALTTSQPLLRSSVLRKHRKGIGNFDMIDWVHDMEAHKRFHQKRQAKQQDASKMSKLIESVWLECYGWIAVLIIGCLTGLLAGMIHTSVDFLRDLSRGMCSDAFWLSYKNCCPHLKENEYCKEWNSWGDYFAGGIRRSTSTTVLDYFAFTLVSTCLACLSAWLVKTFAPYAAGSGIPEIKTILSGVHIKRYLNEWTLLIKCIGVSLSVGAGLSLGMEGPFVHVASCVGNITAKFFKGFRYHESKKREVISASVAAGVSVAFGAPIGGVLFSLEEASYYFPHKTMWRSFFCAVVAAIVLKRVDPSGTGRLVLFHVSYNHQWHWFELVPYSIIGVMGGVVGAVFIELNLKWCKYRRSTALKYWPITEVCAVTLVTATLNFVVPYFHAGAGEFIAKLFQSCSDTEDGGVSSLCSDDLLSVLGHLLLAASLKFLLTIFTFGIKVPAGLFIPSLFIGACLGRMVGIIVKYSYEQYPDASVFSECRAIHTHCVIPGVYAIVGSAAALGGVTRMTLSLVVIIFELTGGLEYLVPVMLAVLISKWVGEWIGNQESIYEAHIEMNGYPYLDPKQEVSFYATAADFMVSSNIQVITVVGWTVADVNDLLEGCDYSGFPVVMSHSDMRIVGYITRNSLVRALEDAEAEGGDVHQDTEVLFYEMNTSERGSRGNVLDISLALDPTPICITPDTTVNRLLHIFKSLGIRTCLVAKNNKLVGLATRKGIVNMLKRYVYFIG